MSKQTFRMVHDTARLLAVRAVQKAPEGWMVVVSEPARNGEQNARLHAMLSELAERCEWMGKKLDLLTWKRLCTASWLREEGEQPEMIPALDGKGFDVIFEKTSQLSKKQCASLMDWIDAFAAERGIRLGVDMETGEVYA